MKQVINIVLRPNKEIKKIIKKYNPNYKKNLPHVTLVYPFDFIQNQNLLEKHIKDSIKNSMKGKKSLEISFKGIKKSFPYIQFLVKSGKDELTDLKNNLYSEILKNKSSKKQMDYPLHMTIGIEENKEKFDKSFKELKKINPKFKTRIKKITLMTFNEDMYLKKKKNFKLN